MFFFSAYYVEQREIYLSTYPDAVLPLGRADAYARADNLRGYRRLDLQRDIFRSARHTKRKRKT